jgi:hypothetical protein
VGRLHEAHQEAELFMTSNPYFRIGFWAATPDKVTLDHFVDGYRKGITAGEITSPTNRHG